MTKDLEVCSCERLMGWYQAEGSYAICNQCQKPFRAQGDYVASKCICETHGYPIESPDKHDYACPLYQRPSNPLLMRLRRYADSEPQQRGGRVLCGEAADEIERLTAERDKWREMTAPFQLEQKLREVERLRAENADLLSQYQKAEAGRLEACNRWYDVEKRRIDALPDGPSVETSAAPCCSAIAAGKDFHMHDCPADKTESSL